MFILFLLFNTLFRLYFWYFLMFLFITDYRIVPQSNVDSSSISLSFVMLKTLYFRCILIFYFPLGSISLVNISQSFLKIFDFN